VTISDSQGGATICFTTNGTTPTTASEKYTGPITVSKTETVKAIAFQTGYVTSPVTTESYTIAAVAPAPAFSKATGTYTGTQTVTMTDSVAGATIYYTVNGTTPTTASTKYSGAIQVTKTEKLSAIAVATGHTNSSVSSVSLTITTALATPAFSKSAGSYPAAQTVELSDAVSGATIHYTTDGTTPTASSTKYAGPISISKSEKVMAIAVLKGHANSSVAEAAYTINEPLAKPAFSKASGTYATVQTVSITDAEPGATIYYTTDVKTPTASSTKYKGPIVVSKTETIEAIAILAGHPTSSATEIRYAIQ
jgi:hypothetical protein